jgi:MFS family permease
LRSWFESTFVSLAIRPFRILFFGTLFSFVAFFMSMIVQSVVAFELAGNNRAVGFVVFAQGLTMASLGPIGGAYADRWPKRRVVVICQLISAVVFLVIAFLIATDRIHIVSLAIGAMLMGATFAFLGPARQSMVIDLVPEHRRGNAMAINLIANTVSRVLGPVIAGLLLGWPLAGATGAYIAMAMFYGVSAMSMVLLPRSQVRPNAGAEPILASVLDGLRYVWGHPRLKLLVIFFLTVILFGFPHVTLLPGLLVNVYGVDPKLVSQLYLASAVGAVVASVAVARFADSSRAIMIYSVMAVLFGLGIASLAVAPSLSFATAAMLLVGIGSGGFQALNAAVIARETEPSYMGRVMSLTMLAFAGFGLMALPIGVLADWIGERNTLIGMSIVVIGISFIMGSALAREARRRDSG